jgi:hypothetical protein
VASRGEPAASSLVFAGARPRAKEISAVRVRWWSFALQVLDHPINDDLDLLRSQEICCLFAKSEG